jgi:hypothetical protein
MNNTLINCLLVASLFLFSIKGFGQDFFLDSPEKTKAFFKENKDISILEIKELLFLEYKFLERLYSGNKRFDRYNIDALIAANSNPERYVSTTRLPDFYTPQQLLDIFLEKKEDLNYKMYHTEEDSTIGLSDAPSYRGRIYSKDTHFAFLAAYKDGKETLDAGFDFYTHIDSIKVLYSYRRPKTIDSIRIKVGAEQPGNKYGITAEKYKDYGVILNIPYNPNFKILDRVGIDENGTPLVATQRSTIAVMDSLNYDLQNQAYTKAEIVVELYKQIDKGEIISVKEFRSRFDDLKKKYGFTAFVKSPILSQRTLLQVYGYAKEVVLYLQTEEELLIEKFNIKNQEELHPIFATYTDSSLDYTEPNEFFYNKKKKKKLSGTPFQNITYLGGPLFLVEDKNEKCERLLITKEGTFAKFDQCDGGLAHLSNGGFMIQQTNRYGEQQNVKIFDDTGKLRYEGKNGSNANEFFEDSHFVLIFSEGKRKLLLGNYEQTELFDDLEIYRPHRALVYKDNKCGIIDDFGKELVPINYTDCNRAGWDHFIAKLDGEYVIVSDNNTITHKETEHALEPLPLAESEFVISTQYMNLVVFIENGLYGLKNIYGKIVYPAKAIGIQEVGNYRIAVRLEDDSLGVIDEKGKTIIPFEYEDINPYYGEYAILVSNKGKKFTFFDYNGKVKITHEAEESYEIWNIMSRPTLILDDKIHIRYNGVIFDRKK